MKVKAFLALAVLAAGIATAAVVTPRANAWDIGSLPNGFTASAIVYPNGSVGPYDCQNAEQITAPDGALTTIGSGNDSFGDPCNANFQSQLDAFVNAHYSPPATTSTDATTTTQTTTSSTTEPAATTSSSTTTTTTQAAAPVADFTTSTNGLAVTFTDTTTHTADLSSISWHFGDGADATGTTATHTYTAAGTFTVVEIVTDTNGLAAQTSQDIQVSPFGGTTAFAETISKKLGTAATSTYHGTLAIYCVKSWGKAKPERGYGLSIVGSHQVNIWNAGCTALAKKKGPVMLALLVLGHEAAHALGIKSEKTADCYSLKRIPILEKKLRIKDTGERARARKNVYKRWHIKRC